MTSANIGPRDAFRVEILRSPLEWREESIDAAWQSLCRAHGSLEVLFQSSVWLEHLRAMNPTAQLAVVVGRSSAGGVVAVAPLDSDHAELDFVVGPRRLGRYRLPCLTLLGSQPAAAPLAGVDRLVLDAVVRELGSREAIVVPIIPREARFRREIDPWLRRDGRIFAYSPLVPGAGHTHALVTPSRFDEYFATHFNSKQRTNVRRRLKLLQTEIGALRLQPYSTADEVSSFLAEARMVSRASWQYHIVGPHFGDDEDWERKLRSRPARRLPLLRALRRQSRGCLRPRVPLCRRLLPRQNRL